MRNSLTFIYLIIGISLLSCGDYFAIKDNALEKTPAVDKLKIYMKGVLINSSPPRLVHEEKNYEVNEKYSSPLAKKFLNSLNTQQKIAVRFTGGFRKSHDKSKDEVILEDVLKDNED